MEDSKRPQNVPFPNIWKKFSGKRAIDGSVPEFWIQDIPDDRHEDAVEVMRKGLLTDEPICKNTAPQNGIEYLKFLRNALKHKMSLGCFTKKPGDDKPVLVGANVMLMAEKNEENKEKDNEISRVVKYMLEYKDPFKALGINQYLKAVGLAVLREYRGQNVGLELLKARFIMMKAFNIKTTMTVFSSVPAQILAERVGFKDFVTLEYEEIWRDRPDIKVPGVTDEAKYCKLMYKFVE